MEKWKTKIQNISGENQKIIKTKVQIDDDPNSHFIDIIFKFESNLLFYDICYSIGFDNIDIDQTVKKQIKWRNGKQKTKTEIC